MSGSIAINIGPPTTGRQGRERKSKNSTSSLNHLLLEEDESVSYNDGRRSLSSFCECKPNCLPLWKKLSNFFSVIKKMGIWILHGATLGVLMELLAHDIYCEINGERIKSQNFGLSGLAGVRVGIGTFHLVFSICFEAFQCWKFVDEDERSFPRSRKFGKKPVVILYAISYMILVFTSLLLLAVTNSKVQNFCLYEYIIAGCFVALWFWETVEMVRFALFAYLRKRRVYVVS